MEFVLYGILLGMGAAIPIGPVNLEIARRNLQLGLRYGIITGLGACTADVVYLCILSLGALSVLQHKDVLAWVNIIGSLILAWFGIQALRAASLKASGKVTERRSLLYYWSTGFSMTLFNPYNILFWASVSVQAATVAKAQSGVTALAGLGVIIGTVGWILTLNFILHWTRHYLSANIGRFLNLAGGIILLGFSAYGLLHSVQ